MFFNGNNFCAGVPPPFHSMFAQHYVSSCMFSMYMTKSNDMTRLGKDKAAGEIIFGGTDETKFVGPMVRLPVIDPSRYWAVTMDELRVGNFTMGTDLQVIVDTGSSICIGPPDQVANLHAIIDGTKAEGNSGEYNVGCPENPEALPDVTFKLGGLEFTLDPMQYTIQVDQDSCLSGFMELDLPKPYSWLLGDIFLSTIYTEYDCEKKTVGFAKRPSSAAVPKSNPKQCPTKASKSGGLTKRVTKVVSQAGKQVKKFTHAKHIDIP